MRRIIRNGAIYTLGNALNAALPLLLLPLLTHSLTPEQYSKIALFQMFVFILSPLIGLEGVSAISRFYFEKNAQISRYIVTALLLSVVCGIFVIALQQMFGADVAARYDFNESILLLSAVYCVALYPYNICLAIVINRHQAGQYTAATLAFFCLNIALTAVFYYMSIMDEYLRIGPMLLAAVICGALSLIALTKMSLLGGRPNAQCLSEITRFSSPLVVHTLSGALLGMGPLLVMTNGNELENVAYYNIALTLGSVIGILGVGINKAITPWLLESYERNANVLQLYGKYAASASLGLIAIVPLYLLIEPLILRFNSYFIDGRHLGYAHHLKWVVVGFILNTIYLLYVNVLICIKETGALAMYSFASSGLGILVAYAAMSIYGAELAGAGMTIAFAALSLCVYIKSNRHITNSKMAH